MPVEFSRPLSRLNAQFTQTKSKLSLYSCIFAEFVKEAKLFIIINLLTDCLKNTQSVLKYLVVYYLLLAYWIFVEISMLNSKLEIDN